MKTEGSNKIRVGLVGTGNWAQYAHIPALKLLPQYEITAVAARTQESADAVAHKHHIPFAFDDFQALARHPEVDLVSVLTVAPQHEMVVRAAIDAGKDVYCEWPLTPEIGKTEALYKLAEEAGVRHLIGLQRRLAPSARYLHDLLTEGYAGRIRSVRMHVSEGLYQERRPSSIAFTIDPGNFTNAVSVYGGHFMDMLFTVVGEPRSFAALAVNQFEHVTLIETGESISTSAPDELVLCGMMKDDAVLSIHVEGGKRNGFGLQIDITGTEGDLRMSNAASFHNAEDNRIEGARGEGQRLEPLPIPEKYNWLPPSELTASAQELANIYAAFVQNSAYARSAVPTFADAVQLHRFLETLTVSSGAGQQKGWSRSLPAL